MRFVLLTAMLMSAFLVRASRADAKAFENDGLSVTLTLDQARLASNAPIHFTVRFKNVSKETFDLYSVTNWRDWLQIQFEDPQGADHGAWRFRSLVEADRGGSSDTLRPGETLDVVVEIKPRQGQDFEFAWAGNADAPPAAIKQLAPAKYKLVVALDVQKPPEGNRALIKNRSWTGQIITDALDLEITAPAHAQAPASQPTSNDAVVVDGLATTVSMAKKPHIDEAIDFTVEFENVSEKAIRLRDTQYYWNWKIQFAEDGKKDGWEGPWIVKPLFEDDRDFKDTVLKPGESLNVAVSLKHDPDEDFEFDWTGNQDRPVPPVKNLPPGKYNLTLSIEFKSIRAITELPDYWTGKIETKPLPVEILPADQK